MTEKRYKCHLASVGVHIGVGTEEHELTGDECRDLLNELSEENEQLKQQINKLEAQLHCPFDSICIKCNNEYLVQKGEYYVSRCKKGHEQCSKIYVRYCDDFELKGDD